MKKQMTLTSFFKRKEPLKETQDQPKNQSSAKEFKTPQKPVHSVDSDEDIPIKRIRTEQVIDSDEEVEPKKCIDLQGFRRTPIASPLQTPRTTHSISTPKSVATPKSTKSERFKEKNEARYSWLLEIRDANGNSPSHPDYDPRTLYIPKQAWNSFTPFEKQFWEIKSKHWDTVVFFKKGKFFELYEKDADIGHQQFDLKLTDRVNMKMVGVPESSFHHWASQFIAKGYKVAKVEQMENAVGKQLRDKQSTKKEDNIIKRELTCVLTCGTLVDSAFLTTDMSTFCMSIKEHKESENAAPKFGVCFVDTATAELHISFFEDDQERTKFETLITQINPKELVLEKNMISKETLKILRNNLKSLQINYLNSTSEFWTAEITMDELLHGSYFTASDEMIDGIPSSWPKPIQQVAQDPVALSSLGGLLSYLRTLKLDKDMISANNISIYDTIQSSSTLILDGQTLINLEVFQNTTDGSEKGTLIKLLNHATTPFGKRLFQRWVCHPLRNIDAINDRLDAVDDLFAIPGFFEEMQAKFRKLPDLERVIARIHSGTCLVKDFVYCLEALETIRSLIVEFEPYRPEFKSHILKRLTAFEYTDQALDALKYFREAFDHSEAISSGKIEMFQGYDTVLDEHRASVERIEAKLEKYRKECEKQISCSIQFKDIGKEIFQMEVSTKAKVPRDWMVMSKTQQVNRYYSSTLRNMVNELVQARELCEIAMRDIKLRVYQRFDEHYNEWLKVVQNIAYLDCLFTLTQFRRNLNDPSCRPEFVDDEVSILDLKDMRHPCITENLEKEYIPNDLTLRNDSQSMVCLTGANMAGKSTLLRQTCIAVLMAQLGCYIPASSCRLTPFDRIFTRIGANDNIMAGQSTFMVELSETSKILKEATAKSLVILDELGRGTSTFDGYAIAYAVLHHLVTRIGCLGLFSTHYGTLTREFQNNKLVALKYMDFHIDQQSQEVVFLYKLRDGVCPESYGMNVARMAQVPQPIIQKATEIAKEFDETHQLYAQEGSIKLHDIASFHSLMHGNSLDRIWLGLQ